MNILVFISCFIFAITFGFSQDTYITQRQDMVNNQLKIRGIVDLATINAMRAVPRHVFVPENAQKYAYEDRPLSIGKGQTISQPYIVAFMTQELRLQSEHKVLEIGTGSGYQAAVLAEIAKEVYTIEIIESLGKRAKEQLDTLGYQNVEVRIGDGYHGWKEKAPFDAIIVTAGIDSIPKPLLDQLAEGGRMIIPAGPRNAMHLLLVTKNNGKVRTKKRLPVRFVPFVRGRN
ncbi:protein-L-isoaspartate(D-aspartate) O-methyltransferase [Aquimarina mytili]|uniref:Protein-L-isoaspartate O-methyltransferase n=1 Tax=Aquimarina mytili TaxID=874423 RepID=A0A937A1T2_9FLAO|nr:protein-L-isoaspartate(D-aspartate) O-methyltransferase [Aquimarina mytili]MBL0682849.1 protein-L-isoaspartate(D-aspartate) O-methyltransferase [Aquimarina mytili]